LVTFLLYDLVVKRTRLTRLLFGLRPKKKKEEAQEQTFDTA
jgi:hypothetical protein